MKNTVIKELARICMDEPEHTAELARYLLSKLKKKAELKTFIFYLKKEIAERNVLVTLAGHPEKSTENAIKELFKEKQVAFGTDKSLGAGLTIEHGDNVISMNIKNMIERAIGTLKGTL